MRQKRLGKQLQRKEQNLAPECITSLFRELVSVPIALACSNKMTLCPFKANALHIANPTTPARQSDQTSLEHPGGEARLMSL